MRPQLSSRAPAAIDTFLDLLTVAVDDADHPLHGVQVIDGPVKKVTDLDDDAVAVAPGDPDTPGFVSTFEAQPGAGPAAYVERIEVGISAVSYSGRTDMQPRRARVGEIIAGVKAVLDANQTSDAWDAAAMGAEMSWYPQQLKTGASVEVAFTVVFRAIV